MGGQVIEIPTNKEGNVCSIFVTPSYIKVNPNACSVKDYAEVIIALCENVLSTPLEELATQWGIESDISKLIIALYDETANSDNGLDQDVAEKCLGLWDVMFEKQIGQVRDLSRKLMER